MSRLLLNFVAELMGLLMGIFRKPGVQTAPITPPPVPIPPIQPAPIVAPPSIAPIPVAAPVPVGVAGALIKTGPQSHYWKGIFPITQKYGCTNYAGEGHNPYHPECAFYHEGIDYGLPCGTPIYAPTTFKVKAIDPPGYGPPGNSAAIQLRAGKHDVWLYHMANYAVHVGQTIAKGTLIGHSGTRGYSTGCHIHFEVRLAGMAYRHSVNPVPFL